MFAFLTRSRYRGRIHITDLLTWAWLVLGGLAILIPISWAAISSVKDPSEITRFPPRLAPYAGVKVTTPSHDEPLSLWIYTNEAGEEKQVALMRRIGLVAKVVDPSGAEQPFEVPANAIVPVEKVEFAWRNYSDPFVEFNFLTYLKNSVFVTAAATILTLLFNSMAAFALSKYRFKGRDLTFVLIISTLMIPLTVVLVPAFLIVMGLGLTDSLWAIVLSGAATPTGVFLLRQYMLTIPDELIEAARIDGASEFRIYWKVILPLCAPALAVLAIFSAIWRWNDFLWPLVVLASPENYTLQVGLNSFQGEFTTAWHYILAMTVLSLLPVTAVFVFVQKYITTGVASTGMK